MVDSGSWYSRVQWPHDGDPYESQNFMVYSDAANQEARQAVAEIGEELLAELIAEFGIAKDMFRFPPGQDKIHIYAYKNRYPQAWGARGYYAGLIIWSLDHEKRDTDLNTYLPVAKHELVHVVEALLKGRDVADMTVDTMVHVWFSEGFAEAVVGGTLEGAVKDLDYLNHLTAKYGKLSPISFIHDGMVGDWSKTETPRARTEYHYPMYRLAVEYLMDADGFGKSPQDLAGIFMDIADGSDFRTAFENRVGISQEDYEEQFFDLMNDYLPESDLMRFKRASLAWLVLTAGSLIVLAWSLARGTGTRWGLVLVWLLFRAPLVAARSRRPYLVAAFRSLPAETLSTILVLSGMLTVLIQLSEHYWWFSLDPGTPLFWSVLSVGAIAGSVIVYPFNLWMVRRVPRPSRRRGASVASSNT